jgi:hypothetical protein
MAIANARVTHGLRAVHEARCASSNKVVIASNLKPLTLRSSQNLRVFSIARSNSGLRQSLEPGMLRRGASDSR